MLERVDPTRSIQPVGFRPLGLIDSNDNVGRHEEEERMKSKRENL